MNMTRYRQKNMGVYEIKRHCFPGQAGKLFEENPAGPEPTGSKNVIVIIFAYQPY